MRACIVHANILANHTTTGFSLPLVLLRLHYMPPVYHVVFSAQIFHQQMIFVEQTHHHIIINTLVVGDSEASQVNILGTCRKL